MNIRHVLMLIGGLMCAELVLGVDLGTFSLAAALAVVLVMVAQRTIVLPTLAWFIGAAAIVIVVAVAIEATIYHHGYFVPRLNRALFSLIGR